MALDDFRSVFLPYCLQKQPDGTYAVLNREYKPVGFKTSEFIVYSDYPVCVTIKELTSEMAGKLSYNGSIELDTIFLYDDASNPIRSKKSMGIFLEKLAMLAQLRVA